MTEQRLHQILDDAVAGAEPSDLAGEAWQLGTRRRRRRTAATVAAAAAVVAVISGGAYLIQNQSETKTDGPPPANSSTAPTAPTAPSATAEKTKKTVPFEQPPLPFAVGNRVVGLDGGEMQLAEPVDGALGTGPAAAVSPDGTRIIYSTMQNLSGRKSIPNIRVHDMTTGEDRELVSGAYSFAEHEDGRFAYFRRNEPVVDGRSYARHEQHIGHLEVRDGIDGTPTVWSTVPERMSVLGWAGDRLVVLHEYDVEVHHDFVEVMIYDGPGQEPRGFGIGSSLVAISPDGSQMLITVEGVAQLVDVATGEVLDSLDLGFKVHGHRVEAPTPYSGGDWTEDRIVAELGSGLLSLQIVDDQIVVDDYLHTTDLPFYQLSDARWLDESTVIGWTPTWNGNPKRAVVTCSFADANCERGAEFPVTGNYSSPYALYVP